MDLFYEGNQAGKARMDEPEGAYYDGTMVEPLKCAYSMRAGAYSRGLGGPIL